MHALFIGLTFPDAEAPFSMEKLQENRWDEQINHTSICRYLNLFYRQTFFSTFINF